MCGVTYHYLPSAQTDEYEGFEVGVDCDLAAVCLANSDGEAVTITWGMRAGTEGLAVLRGYRYSGKSSKVLEAPCSGAWPFIVGEKITSVGASWHVSEDQSPRTLWALRLSTANKSVVLALGAFDPELYYVPDELVVIHDPDRCRKYRPAHVESSAWGAPLSFEA